MFKLFQQPTPHFNGSQLLGIRENDNEDLSEVTYRPSKVFIYPSNEKLYGNELELTPKFKAHNNNYGFFEGG
jgi:hypothetical protein